MHESEPEGTELIKVLKVDLSDAVRMVLQSEISHGPSCVLILKAQFLTQGGGKAYSGEFGKPVNLD